MIQVTSQVLYDGLRNVVMQFTGAHDGQDGQEENVVKVDVSALVPTCKTVKIKCLTYDVQGGVLRLSWDAKDPVPFLDLGTGQNSIDYCRINGMPNGGGDTATGNILFSTLGFDIGSSYSIKLEMVKKGVL